MLATRMRMVGGGVFPTISRVAVSTGGGGSSDTYNALSIGAASTSRAILVCISMSENDTATDCSSLTIDGEAMTKVVDANNYRATAIFIKSWPTGTTASFVATFNRSLTGGSEIAVYAVMDLDNVSAYDTGSDAEDSSNVHATTVNVPYGGILVAVQAANDENSFSWVGATEDYAKTSGGNPEYSVAIATEMSAETNRAVQCTATDSGGRGTLSVATFR